MGSVKMEDLRKELEGLLETKMEKLRSQIVKEIGDELVKIANNVKILEARVTECENYSRRNNVVFYGVPSLHQEDPLVTAEKLGDILGVSMKPSEVEIAHRLKSRNTKQPPPFIIRLVNRWKKDKILAAAKQKMPMADEFGGSKTVRIYANEHLSPQTQMLFAQARKLKENYFVWTKNGQVLVRKKVDKAQPMVITYEEDIEFISESQEANIEGSLYQRTQKRGRDCLSSESSPAAKMGMRELKKALRTFRGNGNAQASQK